MSPASIIADHLDSHLAAVEGVRAQTALIEDLAQRIILCFEAGGKVLVFGNGGSAADAQHIAAEFVVRYRRNRKALPAIALSTDTSILTAGGNDFGFESIFARQVEALGNPGDIAIGISTSGNSPNVLAGLEAARLKGCFAVAFTAKEGGKAAAASDLIFKAPSPVTAHAQECHMIVAHVICEIVEDHFING